MNDDNDDGISSGKAKSHISLGKANTVRKKLRTLILSTNVNDYDTGEEQEEQKEKT